MLLTKVVGRLYISKNTADVGTNPDPLTVRVKAGPLNGALAGDREVIVGTGLFGGVPLPSFHNSALPPRITESLIVHIVPTDGETCIPTVA